MMQCHKASTDLEFQPSQVALSSSCLVKQFSMGHSKTNNYNATRIRSKQRQHKNFAVSHLKIQCAAHWYNFLLKGSMHFCDMNIAATQFFSKDLLSKRDTPTIHLFSCVYILHRRIYYLHSLTQMQESSILKTFKISKETELGTVIDSSRTQAKKTKKKRERYRNQKQLHNRLDQKNRR